jgi:hypothetical protein
MRGAAKRLIVRMLLALPTELALPIAAHLRRRFWWFRHA